MPRSCHRCGAPVNSVERVGRRDTCLSCGNDLHCCLNCAFYDVALHNQCREPQAERQVQKEIGNFCDSFSFTERAATPVRKESGARDKLEALFGKRGRT